VALGCKPRQPLKSMLKPAVAVSHHLGTLDQPLRLEVSLFGNILEWDSDVE
jgi:hypothetical protein